MATLAMFLRRPLAAPAAQSGVAQEAFVPPDTRYLLRALPNEDIVLYSKPIDNSRIVREARPTARREWSAVAMAVLLALLLMGLSTPRVANVFAGYQLETLKQEQRRLLDEQRDLNIQEAQLWRQENLEALAKKQDLNEPTANQIVRLEPKSDTKLALNRH